MFFQIPVLLIKWSLDFIIITNKDCHKISAISMIRQKIFMYNFMFLSRTKKIEDYNKR